RRRPRRAPGAWWCGGCTCRRPDGAPGARSRRRWSSASCCSRRARSGCARRVAPLPEAPAPARPAPARARPAPARASPRPAPPPARPAPPSALPAPAPAPCPSLRSSLRSWLRSSLRSFLPNSAGCRLSGVRAHLAQHRLDARDVAPDLPELVRLRSLPRGPLHAQRELLLAQLDELIGELGRGLGAQLLGFHLANLPFHERGGHRELGAGEPERFPGGGLVNPFHLEQHLAGLYARHV